MSTQEALRDCLLVLIGFFVGAGAALQLTRAWADSLQRRAGAAPNTLRAGYDTRIEQYEEQAARGAACDAEICTEEAKWLALRFHRDTLEAQNSLRVTDDLSKG